MDTYEKKYKEALERARKHYKETPNNVYKAMLEQIFPDIEESEDKKIKEEIINYFRCQSRDEPTRKEIHNKWIDWLEKQGEQKPTNSEKTCKPYGQRKECTDCQFNYAGECKGYCAMKRSEQKPADKVEPKFHEGDWVTIKQ